MNKTDVACTIKIYLRSYAISAKIGDMLYSRCHNACDPNLLRVVDGQFDGRYFETESAFIASKIKVLNEGLKTHIVIIDVGRLNGKLRALWEGIRHTPAVVLCGRKFEGSKPSIQAINQLLLRDKIEEREFSQPIETTIH